MGRSSSFSSLRQLSTTSSFRQPKSPSMTTFLDPTLRSCSSHGTSSSPPFRAESKRPMMKSSPLLRTKKNLVLVTTTTTSPSRTTGINSSTVPTSRNVCESWVTEDRMSYSTRDLLLDDDDIDEDEGYQHSHDDEDDVEEEEKQDDVEAKSVPKVLARLVNRSVVIRHMTLSRQSRSPLHRGLVSLSALHWMRASDPALWAHRNNSSSNSGRKELHLMSPLRRVVVDDEVSSDSYSCPPPPSFASSQSKITCREDMEVRVEDLRRRFIQSPPSSPFRYGDFLSCA